MDTYGPLWISQFHMCPDGSIPSYLAMIGSPGHGPSAPLRMCVSDRSGTPQRSEEYSGERDPPSLKLRRASPQRAEVMAGHAQIQLSVVSSSIEVINLAVPTLAGPWLERPFLTTGNERPTTTSFSPPSSRRTSSLLFWPGPFSLPSSSWPPSLHRGLSSSAPVLRRSSSGIPPA